MSESSVEAQNTDASSFRETSAPRKKSWKRLILLPLVLGGLGLFVGAICGFLHNQFSETTYESEAIIRISDPIESAGNEVLAHRDHASMFRTRAIIQRTFDTTDGIYSLASFDDNPKDDVIESVHENLKGEPYGNDGQNFRLIYRSTNPDDARTILSNLIETYRTSLVVEFEEKSQASLMRLLDTKDQLGSRCVELRASIKKIEANGEERTRDELEPLTRELILAEAILAEATRKVFEFPRESQGAPARGYDFDHLQNATFGKQVWPILPILLGGWMLGGMIAGMLLGLFIAAISMAA